MLIYLSVHLPGQNGRASSMANSYFQFKQFTIHHDRCAMKVTTDACLFGSLLPASAQEGAVSALDIGTGTGLLSLMFAQKNPTAVIDAIEMDADAARQAAENVAASPWGDRIKIIRADAREYDYGKKYDVIISNPPFYEKELKGDNIKKNLAHHNEGLLLPELVDIIKKNLAPGGRFYLLLPYKRKEEVKRLFTGHRLPVQRVTFVRQSARHDYFRMVLEGKPETGEQTETMIGEISIRDENDGYTPEFVSLLKEYYLHL